MMTTFLSFVKALSHIGPDALIALSDKLQVKTIAKGECLLKNGIVCRQLYFIDKGLVKTCFHNEDKQFIMKFFTENMMFTVLDSYVNQLPSDYMIVALEPTTVTYINQADLEALCKKHHSIETFFRKLVSFAAINMMKRISEMLEENATARYNHFVNQNNALLQRIPLGELAAYLGITQVTLSRIRAMK
jgi:CRP/FNR family transcriptional regulator, anaerobic regulatory protein